MFGYLKDDLVGKDLRVNMLMPDVFSEKHDGFLRAFHERDNVEVSNLFLKPKMVYGKHRSKYIFPVNLTIRVVPSKIWVGFFGDWGVFSWELGSAENLREF